MSHLILASTSPYRAALLKRLGRPFIKVSPGVDEGSFKSEISDAKALADTLAMAKAQAALDQVKDLEPPVLAIGSDQVIIFQNHILGKPLSEDRAIEQIYLMSGKQHVLYSAVSLVGFNAEGEKIKEVFAVEALMTMWPLTMAEIKRYVDEDQPLDCAGSYKLEQGGIRLFEKIETSDFTTIEGLPLIELEKRLRTFFP